MSERLSTEELNAIEDQCDGRSMLVLNAAAQRDVRAMLAEIRERRSLDLDDEERQVLFMMARDLGRSTAFDDHTWYEPGLVLLDRLLTGGKP